MRRKTQRRPVVYGETVTIVDGSDYGEFLRVEVVVQVGPRKQMYRTGFTREIPSYQDVEFPRDALIERERRVLLHRIESLSAEDLEAEIQKAINPSAKEDQLENAEDDGSSLVSHGRE